MKRVVRLSRATLIVAVGLAEPCKAQNPNLFQALKTSPCARDRLVRTGSWDTLLCIEKKIGQDFRYFRSPLLTMVFSMGLKNTNLIRQGLVYGKNLLHSATFTLDLKIQ